MFTIEKGTIWAAQPKHSALTYGSTMLPVQKYDVAVASSALWESDQPADSKKRDNLAACIFTCFSSF